MILIKSYEKAYDALVDAMRVHTLVHIRLRMHEYLLICVVCIPSSILFSNLKKTLNSPFHQDKKSVADCIFAIETALPPPSQRPTVGWEQQRLESAKKEEQ